MLVVELPTISLSRYTWSVTAGLLGLGCRAGSRHRRP
jgi:hypothetical protein